MVSNECVQASQIKNCLIHTKYSYIYNRCNEGLGLLMLYHVNKILNNLISFFELPNAVQDLGCTPATSLKKISQVKL